MCGQKKPRRYLKPPALYIVNVWPSFLLRWGSRWTFKTYQARGGQCKEGSLSPSHGPPPPPPPRGLIFPLPNLPTTQTESKATTTATATETSLNKRIRAASKFIALIPSRLIRQALAIFLELNSKGLYQSSRKELESYRLVFPSSSTKREIWHLHVVVVQQRLRNVRKAWWHVQSCCFANPNL